MLRSSVSLRVPQAARAALVRTLLSLAGLTLGTACSVPGLDFAAKRCPCAVGWTCDTQTNACVRGGQVVDAAPPGQDNDFPPWESIDSGVPTEASTSPAIDADTPEAGPFIPGSEDAGADAGATEAGLADAAIPDGAASSDSGVDVCAGLPNTTWLSDGFEPGNLGFSTGSYGTGSSLDMHHVGLSHAGSHALRAESMLAGKSATASKWLELPIASCTFYLSTYLYVDATELPSFTVFGFENQTEHKGIRLLYTPQGLQLQVESAGSTLPLQSTAVLLGRWVQVELVVTVGQAGQVTAYVDGNLAADATLNTEVTDGYVHLVLGTMKTQGPVILYADDFLLQRAVPARP